MFLVSKSQRADVYMPKYFDMCSMTEVMRYGKPDALCVVSCHSVWLRMETVRVFTLTIHMRVWLVSVTLAGPTQPLAPLDEGDCRSPPGHIAVTCNVGLCVTFVYAHLSVLVNDM